MQIFPYSQTGHELSIVSGSKIPLALRIGEVVEAEVLNVTETSVAVRMKGTILEAQSNIPLRQGETILVRVDSNGNDIRLRLLQGGESASPKDMILAALNQLKGLKPAAEDIRMLAVFLKSMPESVKALLPQMAMIERMLPSLEQLSGSLLKQAIQNSGVFLETKLRIIAMGQGEAGQLIDKQTAGLLQNDLKAALLQLRAALGNDEIASRMAQAGLRQEALVSTVDGLLRTIEAFQFQSRMHDTLQLFLPLFWHELKDGEVIFRDSGGDQPGEQAYSCTVNLELERAGRLCGRLLLQGGGIHATLVTDNPNFHNLLQQHEGDLYRQFEAAGLKLESFFLDLDQSGDYRPSQTGRLNIKI